MQQWNLAKYLHDAIANRLNLGKNMCGQQYCTISVGKSFDEVAKSDSLLWV